MNQADLIGSLSPILFTVEMAIYLLLLVMGLAVLVIFVNRWRAIKVAQGNTAKWIELLSQKIDGDLSGITVSAEEQKTLAGRVVQTGIRHQGLAPEALEQVFQVQEIAERRALEPGVSFLGTVGANAPFLGLTGTVLGILVAFNKFAQAGGKGSTEVMVAIARALVATSIGLIVAIPAVVAFNVLRNRIKDSMEESREIRGLILARSLQSAAKKEN